MIAQLFNQTITVQRRSVSSVNSLGENVYAYTAVYTNIPARVEMERPKEEYNSGGERSDYFRFFVYVSASYSIYVQDHIYLNSNYIGLVAGVLTAWGVDGKADHYELHLENP